MLCCSCHRWQLHSNWRAVFERPAWEDVMSVWKTRFVDLQNGPDTKKAPLRGHGGAVSSAVASQLEGPGFDSRRGKMWALVARLLLRVISAHTPGGVDERAFLCGVCMFSPCPLGLVPSLKTCSNPGLYTASPWLAGAPDGGGWRGLVLLRANLQVKNLQLVDLLMIR